MLRNGAVEIEAYISLNSVVYLLSIFVDICTFKNCQNPCCFVGVLFAHIISGNHILVFIDCS